MLTALNLSKTFEDTKALDKVCFEIDDGCVYGLVGSNGSGKSTLLRLISGVYKPDEGLVGIDGIASFNNPAVKSQIAFLGDTPYFLPQSNLREMARFYKSTYKNFDTEVYKRLLSIFPLNENARLSTFSKGMRRQAALILMLSTKPRYLLLDEAFDGLDVVMRKTLSNIIIDCTEKYGTTVIIASHNLREIEDMCDHISLLHEGNLIADGGIDEVRGKIHKIQAVFDTVPDDEAFASLNLMKIEHSGSIVSLVAKGEKEEIVKVIESLSPKFYECIDVTLEEAFIYELEVKGYDVKSIED
ncbi:MAG: ABC transporter ATP-binding protein [Clostridia bacterium]|nr:ABC transporter ATP-binding protein [Clostridia bacterium]